MPFPTGRCGICFGDIQRRALIDRELSLNTPHTHIEVKCREIGLPVKRQTIRKHLHKCVPQYLASTMYSESIVESVASPATTSPPKPQPKLQLQLDKSTDFAMLVRSEAIRRMEAGELRVGTRDGLMAQGLIDRREEKRQDREIVVILGKLLSGQQSVAPTLVIEGEYTESLPRLVSGDDQASA